MTYELRVKPGWLTLMFKTRGNHDFHDECVFKNPSGGVSQFLPEMLFFEFCLPMHPFKRK